jgi:outer membrane protein OmpA-like peptidoglycan-associated protein
MVGTGELKMRSRRIYGALIASVMLLPASLSAQELSQQRIITMLGNATKAAPKIIVELNFVNDSVAMEPESYRTLGMIADALHHPNLMKYSFLVVGHTSSTGDAKHNLQLSEDRANAIKEALSTTFAIAPGRLFAVGAGQEYPLDAADPAAAANRRVQLFNLGVLK